MMQSPQAQYQLALTMPMNRLRGILQGQPDAVVGQPIAMMALQTLKQQKTAAQGMQAQQQLQQPNVKDQLLAEDQGIAVASAPNMNAVVNAAHGGIVGYDSGGAVQHFFNEGQVRGSPMDAPTSRLEDIYDYFSVVRQEGNAGRARIKALQEAQRLVQPGFTEAVTPEQRRIREDAASYYRNLIDNPNAPYPGQPAPSRETPAASGYAGYAPAPKADPRLQDAPRPPATPRPRVQSALVPNRVPSTQGEPEPTQYAAPTMPPAQGPQPSSREALSSYEDILGRSQAVTSDYKTQITDLVKQMTASPAEKDRERESRLGAGLLSIASDLLEPGQTSSGARGKAFKTIAGLATQYNKEDKADKRANLGVELSTRMGILQLEQGDRKNATDLFNHAQTISLQQADLAGKAAYQMAEIDAKKRGLSIEETKALATEKHNAAYIGVMQDANRIREKVAGKQITAQENQNRKIDESQRAANLRAYVTSLTESLKNITNPEARKAAQKKIDELTSSLGSTLGFSSAGASGPGFIPKPESRNLFSTDVLGDD